MTPNTKISTLFTQTDRKIVIDKLKNNPLLSVRFRSLKGELKERMIDFLCGTATLPLTYDPFFKKLFNPDIYPERLENFISSVLKKKVKIKCVLSQEDSQLQGATLLILDIIVDWRMVPLQMLKFRKYRIFFLLRGCPVIPQTYCSGSMQE